MKNHSALKQRVFDLLDKSEKTRTSEKVYDVFIIILISLNVLAVIVEPSARDPVLVYLLHVFETFSIIIFSLEYLLRLWISDITFPATTRLGSIRRYLLSPMAIVDLAAVLPFYLPLLLPVDLRVLRVFRIFRTLRIFKANRYTDALTTVLQVIRSKAEQLISSLFVVVSLMVVASTVMFSFENAAQPEVFASVFDALFWSTAMLTNIEYGSIYPVTMAGKLLGGVIALLSMGVIAIPTGIIASGFTEMAQHNAASGQDKQYGQYGQGQPAPADPDRFYPACPHCGQPLMLVPAHRQDHNQDQNQGHAHAHGLGPDTNMVSDMDQKESE